MRFRVFCLAISSARESVARTEFFFRIGERMMPACYKFLPDSMVVGISSERPLTVNQKKMQDKRNCLILNEYKQNHECCELIGRCAEIIF
ncbi:MAG: hypothetical protein B6245_11455 [Desulfobacteraceae bacterium 4572_88]|nr:MAG: hypothetical protein B6245_11455 [Desulfobacteraceae bacterium 4572_88]RLC02351.1 MAG: hypothetical protein DRI57_30135 [Deltaproteobacteria bacterium]